MTPVSVDALATLVDSLGIAPPERRHDHPAVFTCEEGDRLAADVPGARSKNLFLRNKDRSRHYLVSVPGEKRVDIAAFSKLLGESKLSFASAEDLMELLGVEPGSVSPMGALNDRQNRVRVYLDSDLSVQGLMGFHPNTNTATWLLDERELRTLLATNGHDVIVARIPAKSE